MARGFCICRGHRKKEKERLFSEDGYAIKKDIA